jgi:3-isopropylmalate/(R)-2-methylmalate dehydratase small subunit
VIAPSFGDIFFNNSFQNGFLPIVQPAEVCEQLRKQLDETPGGRIVVDLEAQKIIAPDGAEYEFSIDQFRKECLIAGTDEVRYTLSQEDKIAAFEKKYQSGRPWM